jgi:hypothetical protein
MQQKLHKSFLKDIAQFDRRHQTMMVSRREEKKKHGEESQQDYDDKMCSGGDKRNARNLLTILASMFRQ